MKHRFLPLFILPFCLASCSKTSLERKVFCFDTMVEIKLSDGSEEDLDHLEKIFTRYDQLSDNYRERNVKNVFSINNTVEDVTVDADLYQLLKTTFEFENPYFNPLCGSLSKAWKESLNNNKILSNDTITSLLEKMNSTNLNFKDNNVVQKNGEAEIDLGAIAKGYVLDQVKSYLDEKQYKHYLVNAGYSSILLGEKDSDDGIYRVGIKNLFNSYLELKNCYVSTSGISEQSSVIDGITYSHIVNPNNGSAVAQYDCVVVVSNSGTIGDALSTSFMLSSINEIKEAETSFGVKSIVIQNSNIIYQHPELEVKKL